MLYDLRISPEQLHAAGEWVEHQRGEQFADVELVLLTDGVLAVEQGDDNAAWDRDGNSRDEVFQTDGPLVSRREGLQAQPVSVHVVEVFERTDGTYVFADLDDAKAFEATVNGDGNLSQGAACYRTEETVCDHAVALKLIGAEHEATSEAEAASLENGTPVTTYAWKKGEDAPYPDKLECVEYTVYPTDLDEFGAKIDIPGAVPSKRKLWVGLDPDVGAVNVDAGRERLESEGWEVTDWGAA
jgi:hypothetical protein